MMRLGLITCIFLQLSVLTWADISLDPIFGDHMVLQRNQPIRISGKTTPQHEVIVTFAGQTRLATSDENGQFVAWLNSLEACSQGQMLEVRGDGLCRVEDVLIGEVWLASGQSNMAKPMGEISGQLPTDNFETEVAAANHPLIRLFQVPHYGKVGGNDLDMNWLPCEPGTLEGTDFSAVAYYFARELRYRLDIPIGIINSSFGGTMIETWIPKEYLEGSSEFSHVLSETYFAWVDGVQASELYESMIRFLEGFPLQGFIWYQGETNAMTGEIADYPRKMELLVSSWRELWESPDAPFYYVQLAPFRYSSLLDREVWLSPVALPFFWEAQSEALRIPHSGMVVTTDLAGNGHDIHPTNKRDVGIRLGHLALQKTYGVESVEAKSPKLSKVERGEDGSICLFFDFVGKGLCRSDGNTLDFFEVAGKNRQYVPADARIVFESCVIVSSSIVEGPVAVRFAWSELATPNLVNSNGLPVIPFRTDNWRVSPIQTRRD